MAERRGIMVVDDSRATLKLLHDTLVDEGYVVRPVNCGDLALAGVAAEPPELILLDVCMPEMDGFEVCRRLKAQECTRDIPVLFLSGTTEVEERILGLTLGAVDFICKPFQRDELLARVRSHLELSRLQTRLEALVEQRTAELRVANESLQRELDERRRAEEERERLQEQLLQSQKMESVGRLAGGVAHDFNNMLSVILGHAELAMARLDGATPVRNDLEQILNATQRSRDLTRQLLAFARKQTIHPLVLDLNQAVSSLLRMLHRLIGEDIELVWKPGGDLWPVKADPSQVDQVLANLAVNARDAMDGGGRLTIETENVVLDAASAGLRPDCAPGDYVRLTVSDTGCGMDRATLSHIFEPFFTTKEVGRGTGLGLSTVYGVVQQNHGFIQVFSEPRHGAIFRVYLPRSPDGETAPDGAAGGAESSAGGSETILLVEDETAILDLGKGVLEGLGYTVLTAPTPVAALALAEGHRVPIDLLVSDVVMPGMSGQELLRRLRALRPEVRAVFMSGYTADVVTHQGAIERSVTFLQKPFSVRALAHRVREALTDAGGRVTG